MGGARRGRITHILGQLGEEGGGEGRGLAGSSSLGCWVRGSSRVASLSVGLWGDTGRPLPCTPPLPPLPPLPGQQGWRGWAHREARAGGDPQRGLREDVLRKYFLASPRAVAGAMAGKTVNSVLGGWPAFGPHLGPESQLHVHIPVCSCVCMGGGRRGPHMECGSMCLRGPECGAHEKVCTSVCAGGPSYVLWAAVPPGTGAEPRPAGGSWDLGPRPEGEPRALAHV